MKAVTENLISCPRILISALRGSSAKTMVSLAMINSFRRRGIKILPFKKGPDYIDAAWLAKAAGNVCQHLDLYLMDEDKVTRVFLEQAEAEVVSIVEGNRGLFDGVDIHGTYSSARVAKLLQIPVVLIIDCTKTTNTIAPLVLGCQNFDAKVPIGGVILNHVAGKRHGDVISSSVEHHTGLPVLGKIPNLDIQLPERHLGLTTVNESEGLEEKFNHLGDIAEKYLDLDKILEIAHNTVQLPKLARAERVGIQSVQKENVLVGIIRDPAFQFYYPENLKSLQQEGADLVEFNSMRDKEIQPVDLLYIAGGFPEVHAAKISENRSFRESIRKYAEMGMPIYGECGAVIYLGTSVKFNGKSFEMCDVFPLDFDFSKKPAGHGYTEVHVDMENPFFPEGLTLKGHEFHYSFISNWKPENHQTAFRMKKGEGLDGERGGVFTKNVFATYTHIHASGEPDWASCLIETARRIKFSKTM